ncbi:hypothetical protein BX666DRAFT_2105389 [Dichotomocladium elegans]|nr:hypothetical protein BX666DRAFT_2105389 [Dichotomocladium elegans]
MKSVFVLFSVAAALLHSASALTASSINDCPALAPRTEAATSVYDLRPDDIKLVGSLGDSIMAGFALKGINDGPGGTSILNSSSITEYRGQSWTLGGDSGAISLGAHLRRYSPNILGLSVGSHLAELCYGNLICTDFIRYPKKDQGNGALSGALAMNLDQELDYALGGENYNNDWKMITIQIGSNDQCASCNPLLSGEVTADKYGTYVEAAVARIKAEVPKVLVNILGVFPVAPVYDISQGEEYCRPFLGLKNALLNRVECMCFTSGSASDREAMTALASGKLKQCILTLDSEPKSYNDKLKGIYEKYSAEQNSTFAVTFSPANFNIADFSIDLLSNVDCFHPAEKTHQWVAKVAWNYLFLSQANKPSTNVNYDANQQIYCPSETDRIQIN